MGRRVHLRPRVSGHSLGWSLVEYAKRWIHRSRRRMPAINIHDRFNGNLGCRVKRCWNGWSILALVRSTGPGRRLERASSSSEYALQLSRYGKPDRRMGSWEVRQRWLSFGGLEHLPLLWRHMDRVSVSSINTTAFNFHVEPNGRVGSWRLWSNTSLHYWNLDGTC